MSNTIRSKLKDLVDTATGVYEKSKPKGDAYYLQAKHFNEFGKLRGNVLLGKDVLITSRLEKHLLREGDLLLTAKGESNRICSYDSEIGKALASSTFFVMRVSKDIVLPKYLQWYLNTPKMQSVFSNLSKGTHTLSLSKKSLMEVEVEIPPIKQQQKILELHSIWMKEREITLELLEHKESLYQNLFLELAKSSEQ